MRSMSPILRSPVKILMSKLLDVGLVRTTSGNRVFGVSKGAVDGGLDIPTTRIDSPDLAKKKSRRTLMSIGSVVPGFSKVEKSLNADVHRKYIWWTRCRLHEGHMKMLKEEPEKYQYHFAGFMKAEIEPEALGKVYAHALAAIRADPSVKHTVKAVPTEKRTWK